MALTSAEKQRRYRARKSNGNATVTPEGNAPRCDTCEKEYEGIGCSDKCRQLQVDLMGKRGPRSVAPMVTSPYAKHVVDVVMGGTKPTFADLPADVQSDIEHFCSENNDGERSGSHSRAAMTERAIHYQRVRGKPRPRPTGSCLTCGGPVEHPKVVKCLKCCMENR